ncbi:hypothetical protein Tco_0066476 [Tanacetum coccineum]
MVNLEFYDKHNVVAYLKKPSGSEGFQVIVDFLNGSHIRYALTKNPTIYVSFIKKFCQTATIRTVDNGEQEITATVDGKEFTVTEASVRIHLQLADVDGISFLPTTKIFDQLSLMGVERATTIAASLDAEQASGGSPRCQETMGGSIAQTRSERVLTLPRDSPLPRVYTLRSDEGSMTLQELTVLCTTLSKKVEIFEADLKQTKKVYGAAYTKLIMKERMIEEIDQDVGVTLVTPTQGKDQLEDQLGVLSAAKVLADVDKTNVHTYTRRRRAVSAGSGGISTAEESVSTAGALMPVSTAGIVQEVNISIPSPVVVNDKGKGKMKESEEEQTKRTKLQQEQERLGHEVAVRLQEELDEEERQRMARVHEAAQSFSEQEWEKIRVRVEADEELSRRLQAEERNKYIEVDQVKMLVDLINQRKKYFVARKAEAKRNKPMTQAQQRNYMINYIKHIGSHTLQQLKRCSFDELKELFETTMKNVNTFVPMETEDRGRASELAAGSSQATIVDSAEVGSSKRVAEAELDHEGSKRQKTNEALGSVQEQPEEEEKELDDLVMLWNLVKERFSSTEPTNDKERALWVELKRLFKPNTDDTLWKLQRYMHDPLLLVEQHSEMANELLRKIFIQANRPRQ